MGDTSASVYAELMALGAHPQYMEVILEACWRLSAFQNYWNAVAIIFIFKLHFTLHISYSIKTL